MANLFKTFVLFTEPVKSEFMVNVWQLSLFFAGLKRRTCRVQPPTALRTCQCPTAKRNSTAEPVHRGFCVLDLDTSSYRSPFSIYMRHDVKFTRSASVNQLISTKKQLKKDYLHPSRCNCHRTLFGFLIVSRSPPKKEGAIWSRGPTGLKQSRFRCFEMSQIADLSLFEL